MKQLASMNIKFSYLYRDAGNYKNYGEVVFHNPNDLSFKEIEGLIRSKLIEGQWFVVKDWNLPDLHFDRYDEDLDHGWHEFEGISYTNDPVNSDISLEYFIKLIQEYDFK